MATLSLTGCLGLDSGPIELDQPQQEMDAGGMEKHLIFTHDQTEQAVLTIQQFRPPSDPESPIPFRFLVWHREALSIDRLYFKLRAPPTGDELPADIYLKAPNSGPWPEFDIRTEDNLWTIIAVDDIGELGDGSLGLEFILEPVSDPVDELAVMAELGFSNTAFFGSNLRASVHTEFDIITPLTDPI